MTFWKAALPLLDVVGHVRHEVGVAAVGLAHDAVLVVTVIGAAQPQRAAVLEGLAGRDELLHRGLDAAAAVEAGFEEVVVEAHAEGLEVQVLLVAQVGHGELADVVQVLRVAGGGELAVVGMHGAPGQVVVGDVLDVVAVVGRLRPAGIARLEALQPCLGGGGQRGDLHPGVVVIKLARDRPALGVEQVADGVAQRALAAVAHVQRAGRVGRDELHHHLAAMQRAAPVGLTHLQHLGHGGLARHGLEPQVDEARARPAPAIRPRPAPPAGPAARPAIAGPARAGFSSGAWRVASPR